MYKILFSFLVIFSNVASSSDVDGLLDLLKRNGLHDNLYSSPHAQDSVQFTVTNKDIKYVAMLKHIKSLHLKSEEGLDLSPLKVIPDLYSLTLDSCKIDSFPSHKRISKIHLKNVSVKNLDSINNLKKLEELTLEGEIFTKLPNFKNKYQFQRVIIDKTKIKSLKPLAGLMVRRLSFNNTEVEDISPLKEVKYLRNVEFRNTKVKRIDAFYDVETLSSVDFSNTKVSDLNPLRLSKKLDSLKINNTPVRSLNALSDNKRLRTLEANNTQISDLRPLLKCKFLNLLSICNTKVTSLAPARQFYRMDRIILVGNKISEEEIKKLRKSVSCSIISSKDQIPMQHREEK